MDEFEIRMLVTGSTKDRDVDVAGKKVSNDTVKSSESVDPTTKGQDDPTVTLKVPAMVAKLPSPLNKVHNVGPAAATRAL